MLTTIERVLFLQQVPLLASVPTEALAHIASAASEHSLAAGEELWRPGDAADAIYFVVEGEVLLREGDRTVATGGETAEIGMAALGPADGIRDTTAHASRRTTLLRLSRDDFYDVALEHPQVALALWGTGSGVALH